MFSLQRLRGLECAFFKCGFNVVTKELQAHFRFYACFTSVFTSAVTCVINCVFTHVFMWVVYVCFSWPVGVLPICRTFLRLVFCCFPDSLTFILTVVVKSWYLFQLFHLSLDAYHSRFHEPLTPIQGLPTVIDNGVRWGLGLTLTCLVFITTIFPLQH